MFTATLAATNIAMPDTINFDDLKTGTPPSGWTASQTGGGEAKWTVVQDASAPSKPNVLKQSGVATFPVCLKEDTTVKDGFVEVKFKSLAMAMLVIVSYANVLDEPRARLARILALQDS